MGFSQFNGRCEGFLDRFFFYYLGPLCLTEVFFSVFFFNNLVPLCLTEGVVSLSPLLLLLFFFFFFFAIWARCVFHLLPTLCEAIIKL